MKQSFSSWFEVIEGCQSFKFSFWQLEDEGFYTITVTVKVHGWNIVWWLLNHFRCCCWHGFFLLLSEKLQFWGAFSCAFSSCACVHVIFILLTHWWFRLTRKSIKNKCPIKYIYNVFRGHITYKVIYLAFRKFIRMLFIFTFEAERYLMEELLNWSLNICFFKSAASMHIPPAYFTSHDNDTLTPCIITYFKLFVNSMISNIHYLHFASK